MTKKLHLRQSFIYHTTETTDYNHYLSVITIVLNSTGVQHSLPPDGDISPEVFQNLFMNASLPTHRGMPELASPFVETTQMLWDTADELKRQYEEVRANIDVLTRSIKITFLCYNKRW